MLFIYRSCVSNTRRFSILIASPCAYLVKLSTHRQNPSIPPTRKFHPTSKIVNVGGILYNTIERKTELQ